MNKKFKIITKFVLLILFVLPLKSESDKHIMWEVTKDDAKVYLLGSIHMARPDVYPLDAVLTNAYEKSDHLVVEIDMNKIDIFSIMKKAYYKDDTRLMDNLNEDTYKMLQDEFAKLDVEESFYNKMKPWFAVMTLLNLKLTNSGFEAAEGIDMYFLKRAMEDSKPILELESGTFQITLLDSILGNMQDDFIQYSLQDFDSTDSYVDDMFDLWISGDAAGLEKAAFEQYKLMPNADEFAKAFLFDRNINMTEKIKGYLRTDKTYFVVVGAAHLLGEKGIIKLLENENYKVEQK